MPYRSITLTAPGRPAETFAVRISDAAVAEWLVERRRLRAAGYPDRPPDVDTPNLRAWIPHLADGPHPYFRGALSADSSDGGTFMILTLVWQEVVSLVTKVLVTGSSDGSIVARVRIDGTADGAEPIDQVRLYGPEVEAERSWAEIEAVIAAINEAPIAWDAESPKVSDYLDFLDLEAELREAEADARAVGLVRSVIVH
jgi:hypothetical protein